MDRVTVEQEDVSNIKGEYKTIFLCDVLEYVVNAEELLENIKNIFNGRGTGYLVLSVPIFQEERRWDDRFYGHIKRYEIPEIITLLTRKGFEVLDIWDFTFPVFWLLRRIYTWIFPEKMIFNKSREALSSTSSLQNSWDMGILTAIFERIIWWRPIFYLQSKFKKRLIGCECLLVAKFIG